MTATSGYPVVRLMDHVKELSSRNRNGEDLPVYSVTNTEGFLPSGDYFKKQVFSKDTSNYKIVPPDAFAYNPSRINVGSIDFLRHDSSVLVSPLYIVFQTSTALYPAYLKRFLLAESGMNQINHHTQGAVRDSLKFSGLQKIEIPLPPLDNQKRIAAVLDKADALRRQRKDSLKLTEKLLQSVFIDMFGDPMTNPKGLPLLELGRFGVVQTGNTPPRSNKANYSQEGLEWIKTDNIVEDQVVVTPAREKLSASGSKVARVAPAGSLLVACIAGSEKSIGRAALTDRKVAFNQQINSITPHADTSPLYLYFLVKIARQKIQMAAGKGMKKMINKSTFEGLRFIAPEYDDQLRFERVAQRLIEQSEDCQSQMRYLEKFFSSLQQCAFRGELDLSRLVLDLFDDTPAATVPAKPTTKPSKPDASARFLQAPAAIDTSLKKFDAVVKKGETIPWSEDYFKYRILATLSAPFSFSDLMQKAEAVFEEPPPYGTIREMIFDLLGQDGKTALLQQRFDLNEIKENDSAGNARISFEGRKEILFEPVT